MPNPDWRERFWQTSRGRIVARLRRGPAAVDELAALLELTENGVRSHLATLERDGWIRQEGVRRPAGPGKPALLFTLAPSAEALLSSAYRPLLLALLTVLAEHEPEARLDGLMREAGARLARELPREGAREGGPAAHAARLLTLLGGVIDIEAGETGQVTLKGSGCPVGEAVAVTPATCHAVSALLEGALGVPVRDHCDRTGRPSCRFDLGVKASGRRRPSP